MEDTVLQMKSICKSFFGVEVLKSVDFELRPGCVHALVGGNGAGKSTLMKIMTGVYQADSGEIILGGQKVDFRDYSDASKAGIRMIFQEMSCVLTLPVYENIFLNSEPLTGPFLDRRTMKARAAELLGEMALNIDPTIEMGKLTVGERQMVEIAKALAHEPKILIMDEPTASLSESEVLTLFSLIERIKQRGVSIVYISHRMNELYQIADEITVLRDGCIASHRLKKDTDVTTIISDVLGDTAKRTIAWHPSHYEGPDEELLRLEHICIDEKLSDVSFSVRKGEILGIAGLLNSGRTEILETIFGLREYFGGSISVYGQTEPLDCPAAIRKGIALVPEDRRHEGLILGASIKSNISLTLLNKAKRLFTVRDKLLNQWSQDAVRELSIKAEGIHQEMNFLSGGNQQKVVLSKWLKADTRILLLDEPTNGVDIGAKEELMVLVRRFTDLGNCAIFVSSEIPELLAICDRLLILNSGKITAEYSHEDNVGEEVIQHAIQQ